MPFKTGPNGKQLRGLALKTPEERRAMASKGGKASHAPGAKGHEWDSASAAKAGSKGGLASNGGRGKGTRDTAPQEAVSAPQPCSGCGHPDGDCTIRGLAHTTGRDKREDGCE